MTSLIAYLESVGHVANNSDQLYHAIQIDATSKTTETRTNTLLGTGSCMDLPILLAHSTPKRSQRTISLSHAFGYKRFSTAACLAPDRLSQNRLRVFLLSRMNTPEFSAFSPFKLCLSGIPANNRLRNPSPQACKAWDKSALWSVVWKKHVRTRTHLSIMTWPLVRLDISLLRYFVFWGYSFFVSSHIFCVWRCLPCDSSFCVDTSLASVMSFFWKYLISEDFKWRSICLITNSKVQR